MRGPVDAAVRVAVEQAPLLVRMGLLQGYRVMNPWGCANERAWPKTNAAGFGNYSEGETSRGRLRTKLGRRTSGEGTCGHRVAGGREGRAIGCCFPSVNRYVHLLKLRTVSLSLNARENHTL